MADGKVVIDVILNDRSVAKGIANIDGIGKSGERAGLGIGKMVTALGLVKVASAALGVVKSSLDSAISRFDTMQKFPKVMAALGFSSEDSSKSIKKLSDGIDGLPTKLDDVVASTQQLTSITGDLDKSTNTVLALNNAFLASGASTEDANRGMQQYNQMLSSGTVDLESWKTLQETMPLALQKTAEAMGYVGKSAQRDLYAALKNGTVTFDQFQDKLIELGTGTGMLAGLAKENSLGIATSFGNLKNAVSKNLANIITKVNEITKKLTGKTIAQNIDSLKVIINSTFGAIIKSMDSVIPVIDKVKKSMNFTLVGYIIKDAIAIFSTFWKVFTGGVGKEKSINVISGVFKTLNGVIEQVLQNVGLFLDVLSTSKVAEILGQAFKNLRETIVTVVNSLKGMFTYLSSQADSDKVIKILVSAVKIAAEAFLFLTEKVKELAPVIMGVLGKSITWIVKNIGMIKTAAVAAAAGFLAFKTITTIIAIFNAVKTAIVGLKVAFVALKVVMMANPFILIVSAIVGLVAMIIYLWKTNEGFRKVIIGIWEAVKGAFIGAKDAIVGAWNGMVSWFANLWDGIKNAFTSAVNGIKTFMSSSWDSIKSSTTAAWSAIISGIMTVVQPFINVFLNMWNSLSDGLSMMWQGIQMIAQGAWELLKNIILAPVLMIVDLVTGDFSSMGSHLSQIWENIKAAALLIWDGIKTYFSGVITAIVDFATSQFESFKNGLSAIWNFISSTAISVWQSIKSAITNLISSTVSTAQSMWENLKNTVINIFNNILSTASSTWNNIKSSISNAINGAKDAVSNAINSIKNFFTSIGDIDLFEIGKNVIQGLINGIGSMAKAVGDKISEVAGGIKDKITGALGIHSPSRWMRDMVGKNMMLGWEIGIDRNAKVPQLAMQNAVDGVILPSVTAESLLSSRVNSATSGVSQIVNNNYTQQSQNSERPINLYLDGKMFGVARNNDDISRIMQEMENETIRESRGGFGYT